MSLLHTIREQRLWTPVKAGVIFDDRGQSSGGIAVNDITAMQHLTVWRCVALISDAIGQLPAGTYRTIDGVPAPMKNPAVIDDPHPEMSRMDWHSQMLWSVLLRGDAYGLVEEIDGLGQPVAVRPLHPDSCNPERDDAGRLVYRIGLNTTVPPDRMMHIRGLSVPGTLVGLTPISYARRAIGLGLAAQEFGTNYFNDAAYPGGMLTTEQPMDADTAAEYQDRWEEAHAQRRRRIAVMGGGLKFEQISLPPEDSQFLETRSFSRSEIAGFFGAPPHLVGDITKESSWGTGIEEMGLQFVQFTLGPWLRRLEEAWSAKLSRPRYVRYKTNALLRAKTLDRFLAYHYGRVDGWLNADEIRAREEMAPIPEDMGSDYLQPLNYAPVPPGGGAAALPEPPAPPEAPPPA